MFNKTEKKNLIFKTNKLCFFLWQKKKKVTPINHVIIVSHWNASDKNTCGLPLRKLLRYITFVICFLKKKSLKLIEIDFFLGNIIIFLQFESYQLSSHHQKKF